MRKRYNMRVNDADRELAAKTVRNFNARLNYATKTASPEDARYMPERMNVQKLFDSVETRQDFQRAIKKMERFTKKTAEVKTTKGGAKATAWALSEAKREDRRIVRENRKRKEEIENKPPMIGGEVIGKFRPLSGEAKDVLRTQERNFNNMNQKRLDRAFRTIDRMIDASKKKEDLEQMRENYLKGLGNAGYLDADPELEKLIRSVDLETFYETQQIDESATFLWYKDPAGFEACLINMRQSWTAAAEGEK